MNEVGGRTTATLDALGTIWEDRLLRLAALTADDAGRLYYSYHIEHRINGDPRGSVTPARFQKATTELPAHILDLRRGKVVYNHPATAEQLTLCGLSKSWAVVGRKDGPRAGDTVVWGGVSHRVPKGTMYKLFVFYWKRLKPASFAAVRNQLDSDAESEGLVRIVRRFNKVCKTVIQLLWTVSVDKKNEQFRRNWSTGTSTTLHTPRARVTKKCHPTVTFAHRTHVV